MMVSVLTLKIRIEMLARSSGRKVFSVSPEDYELLVNHGVINADGKLASSNVHVKMSSDVPIGSVRALNVTLN